MPLPLTTQQIAQGFESQNPSPTQAQAILDIRTQLFQAAQAIALAVNNNAAGRRALSQVQAAFSSARSSILIPADP